MSSEVELCPQCGSQFAPRLLSCVGCGHLRHRHEALQKEAEARELVAAGQTPLALTKYREALALLPPGTAEAQRLRQEIDGLSTGPGWGSGALGWLMAGGALFKTLGSGLLKAGTFWTMLAAIGVYAQMWGWRFAALLVLAIYVHEMGHVYELTRLGLPFEMPRFIPGVGAVVMLRQGPRLTPREDARVGLAGPWWGLAFCILLWLLARAGGSSLLLSVVQTSGMINLFNLVPFSPLDGGRGVHPLSRLQLALLVALGWWLCEFHGLMKLFVLVGGVRCLFQRAPQPQGDWNFFAEFATLMVLLAWFAQIPVPT